MSGSPAEVKPFLAQLGGPLRAAAGPLCAGVAAAAVVAAILVRPAGPARPAMVPLPTGPPGGIMVAVPPGAHAPELRAAVLREGEVVTSEEGIPVQGIPADLVGDLKLAPGVYVVRTFYRGAPLPDRTV